MIAQVEITAIPGVPDIQPGDDLARLLGDCLEVVGGLRDGDILCIAHKIVSKAEGNIINLSQVNPSPEAKKLAEKICKNPAKVEVVLRQSTRIVNSWKRPDQNEGTMICEHRLGFISANAGVDESNIEGENSVITLPNDPDASAARLGKALGARFGVEIGVVITDTFGRPWRLGQVNVAIGLFGIPAKVSEVGSTDAWGRPLSVTEPAFSDELAAASGLVVKKAAKTPLVRLSGISWAPHPTTSARDILRTQEEDMFR
ncbi:MAG: coenzyme F420-0:L-glutamate ligase [Aestuariivita sp.]|nr:coenzyme F420-0:L-glutamate ligase [Aestuariivita sp.]